MKKLKLSVRDVKDVLTREEMKQIGGGFGSGGGDECDSSCTGSCTKNDLPGSCVSKSSGECICATATTDY